MNNTAMDIYKELGKKMPKKVYKKYCFHKCKGPNFGSCSDCGYSYIDMVFCPPLILTIIGILAMVGLVISMSANDFSYFIKIFIIPSTIFIAGHFIVGFLRYKIRNIKKLNDHYSEYMNHDW